MGYRAVIFCSCLCVSVAGALAQEPNGRIDLDVVSGSPVPTFVVSRVAFTESDSSCPQDRGMLRIAEGVMRQIRMTLPSDPHPTGSWRSARPVDDQTQLYRIESPTCRMDIAVRQEVRREGSWTSLLVAKAMRPSVSPEERQEFARQRSEQARNPSPETRERIGRMKAADHALRTMGSLSAPRGNGMISPFAFDDAPRTCFEASGEYRIESTQFVLVFLTGLPGDLNRFIIERTDFENNRSRLYFVRGDCRFELTVGQSVLRDGQWIPVPLAPVPPGG